VPGVHEVAVLEVGPAHVLVGLAHERDHDADVADGDLRHRHRLDLHEPRVEVPGPGEEHLLLEAAAAAALDERLSVLEAVVAGDGGPGDLGGVDGRAVEGGHDADAVGLDAMHAQRVREHAVGARRLPGDDVEQRRVDAIGARGQDRELAALLAAPGEERARVLEGVAADGPSQDPLAGHGLAVRGHHQPDLALRDHGQGAFSTEYCHRQ
jgi:hypothetical protein